MGFAGVRVTVDRVNSVLQGLKSATENRVLVGIPQDKTARKDEPITNAAIGYIAENGAPEANIPAHPWRDVTVRQEEINIVALLKKAGTDALDGKDPLKTLNALGLQVKQKMQSRVTEGIPPPLAPSTLAARKRTGRSGIKPLIVTGQFRNAINYVIRKKGA